MITLYGIKTCDTCRKARKALDAQGTHYQYHDLREDGLSAEHLEAWLARAELATLLNTRSTTWRALAAEDQQSAKADPTHAQRLILAQPTLLKRPVLDTGERLLIGFTPDDYAALAS